MESAGSITIDVTSPRFLFGRLNGSHVPPKSWLSYNKELRAPTSNVLGVCGSTVTVMAVPPNGPAIFQSVGGTTTDIPATATAASPTATANGTKSFLTILAYFCFKSPSLIVLETIEDII